VDRIAAAWDRAERAADLGSRGANLVKAIRAGIETPELQEAALRQVIELSRVYETQLPALSDEAGRRTRALVDAVNQAFLEGRPELADAVGGLIAEFDIADRLRASNTRAEAELKRLASEAKRQAEDAARAVRETALAGFTDERGRQEIIQRWGALGSDAILALTTALADPAHTRSAGEQLARGVVDLTRRLEAAGVPAFRELGADLMAAAQQAITGGISQGAFEQQMRAALAQLPQLTAEAVFDPASFERAMAASGLPASARRMGDLMRQQLKDGFSSAEAVADFQRASGELLREVDRLGEFDPDAARAYAQSFLDAQRAALADVSLEGTRAFEQFVAEQVRSISLDVAQAEYDRKIGELLEQRDTAIRNATRGARVSLFDALERVITERGSAGLDVARLQEQVREIFNTDVLARSLRADLGEGFTAAVDFATEQIAQAAGAFNVQTGLREAEQRLRDSLDRRLEDVRESLRDEVQAVQDAEAAKARARANARQEEDAARSRGREDAELQITRQQQLAEAQIQLQRRLAAATPEQRTEIQSEFALQQQDRARQLQYEDAARARRRGHEEQDRQLALARQQQDVAAQFAQREAAERLQVAQRDRLRAVEMANQREIERERDALADRALARQLVRSAAATQQELLEINKRFALEQAETTKAYDRIRAESKIPAWREDLAAWEGAFLDPAMAGLARMGASLFSLGAGLVGLPPGVLPGLPPAITAPAPASVPTPAPPTERSTEEIIESMLHVLADRPQRVQVYLDGKQITDNVTARQVDQNRNRTLG
jgi:hypothetical protein